MIKTLHPIQVVARRTGLSADVIRAWERRYEAVLPKRSATSRRLYSNEDVERLTLLRQATQFGRRIGDVARLPLAELQALVELDSTPVETVSTAPPSSVTQHSSHLEECLAAVRKLDATALDAALANAALALSIPLLLDGLICGLLSRIGAEWRTGTLRVCHEHMVTAQLRTFLGGLISQNVMTTDGPTLLVTTPRGQRHELGALMVAVIAVQSGWYPVYLGPDIPSDEIAFAATDLDVRAVALSISHPADDPKLPEVLLRLGQQLPKSAALLAGGAAAPAYRQVLDEINALQLYDLKTLGTLLDEMRQG
jgi:DNA-binding transcriptional MerR regulator/methylmalonyl-CoA mutase cobalamin-binding subunit